MTSFDHNAKQEIVTFLLDMGFLLSPDAFTLPSLDKHTLPALLDHYSKDALLVLTKDVLEALTSLKHNGTSAKLDLNWFEFDGSRVLLEKNRSIKPYSAFLEFLHLPPPITTKNTSPPLTSQTTKERSEDISHQRNALLSSVTILKSYEEPSKKRSIKDFVSYYRHRYHFASSLLRGRTELNNLLSINRLKNRAPSTDSISLIGLIFDKITTKNGNIILSLEDPTGQQKIFINKDGPLKDIIPYITCDEVIGVQGFLKNNLLFAKTILFPDIPFDHKGNTTSDEVYAAFISDVHVGSKVFLEQEFLRFIDWLNGKIGTHLQQTIAKKIKYLFIVGDVVDGVGVYPGQESELSITDIYEQYKRTKELLSLIRDDIHIIMCPGNHDAVRIAEPQPPSNEFSAVLSELKNLTLVSNPSFVTIHKDVGGEGIKVLMYHGYSYDYYAATIEPIRAGGAYDRVDLIMKYLLQKRHLAPSHTSTLYLPCVEQDPLLIDPIPDIFVSGHVHKSAASTYNGILLICCSCWQAKTAFQEKLGHNPDPCRVPIVNLKTRDVTILNFNESLGAS